MKVSVSIYITSKEDECNFFNYNKITDIEDFELLIRDICNSINKGEIRNKIKVLGEDIIEE